MSYLETAKGFIKPVGSNSVREIPDDIVDAHNRLQAKRKLELMLKTKSTSEVNIAVGDNVEVYSNNGMGKTGTQSTPRIVLLVDQDARTITIPAKGCKRAAVAVENVRLALLGVKSAHLVQSAIDSVDDSIDNAIEKHPSQAVHTISDHSDDTLTEHHEYAIFPGSSHHSSPTDENVNAVALRRGERV